VGVLQANSNSPMQSVAFTQGNEFRIVGCGLRIMYQGSEFQRSGVVVLHRSPGNTAILGGSSSASLLQYPTSCQAIATRRAESVNYRPDTPNQLGYSSVVNQASQMMAYVEGGTPGTVWNYELVQFVEVIGNVQNPTVAHSDPVGLGAVLGALPVVNSAKTPVQQEIAMQKGALRNVQSATSQVVSFLGATAKTIGGALTGNPANFFAGLSDGLGLNIGSLSDGPMLLKGGSGPLVEEID